MISIFTFIVQVFLRRPDDMYINLFDMNITFLHERMSLVFLKSITFLKYYVLLVVHSIPN